MLHPAVNTPLPALPIAPPGLRYARPLALLLALALVLGAWRGGLFARLGEPRQLADALVAIGGWGYLAFVLTYGLLQPFGVPGTVFVVAAPLIWPWPVAFGLSMTGTMLASVVGFSFARFVARDWVSSRIPARLRRYNEALAQRAFQTVFLLRLVLWMPQALHFFLGVSRVRFWTHFWASLLGYIAPLLMVSYLGGTLFDAHGAMRPGAWRPMAALALGSLVLVLALRWRDRRRTRAAAGT